VWSCRLARQGTGSAWLLKREGGRKGGREVERRESEEESGRDGESGDREASNNREQRLRLHALAGSLGLAALCGGGAVAKGRE